MVLSAQATAAAPAPAAPAPDTDTAEALAAAAKAVEAVQAEVEEARTRITDLDGRLGATSQQVASLEAQFAQHCAQCVGGAAPAGAQSMLGPVLPYGGRMSHSTGANRGSDLRLARAETLMAGISRVQARIEAQEQVRRLCVCAVPSHDVRFQSSGPVQGVLACSLCTLLTTSTCVGAHHRC